MSSPVDGVVKNLYCDHGDKVAKDQLLAKLQNTDLELAITDVNGQLLAAGAHTSRPSSDR